MYVLVKYKFKYEDNGWDLMLDSIINYSEDFGKLNLSVKKKNYEILIKTGIITYRIDEQNTFREMLLYLPKIKSGKEIEIGEITKLLREKQLDKLLK